MKTLQSPIPEPHYPVAAGYARSTFGKRLFSKQVVSQLEGENSTIISINQLFFDKSPNSCLKKVVVNLVIHGLVLTDQIRLGNVLAHFDDLYQPRVD